jgi:hypothetical protein
MEMFQHYLFTLKNTIIKNILHSIGESHDIITTTTTTTTTTTNTYTDYKCNISGIFDENSIVFNNFENKLYVNLCKVCINIPGKEDFCMDKTHCQIIIFECDSNIMIECRGFYNATFTTTTTLEAFSIQFAKDFVKEYFDSFVSVNVNRRPRRNKRKLYVPRRRVLK